MKQTVKSFILRLRHQGEKEANASFIIKIMITGLSLTLLAQFFPFFASCEAISDQIIRLHVVANSDNKQDQDVKLKVRDAVLAESAKWYQNAKSYEEANAALCLNLGAIERAAKTELARNDHPDLVTATVTERYFSTRHYEGFSLPAGKYRTLQITIGEGKGKNWWCMVYPALCLPASEAANEDVLAQIPDDERDIISHPDTYQVRFKLVEWYHAIRKQFDQQGD